MLALKLGTELARGLLSHPPAGSGGPVQVLSSTSGRIRLRVSAIKGAPHLALRTQSRLAAQPGVKEVVASPVTGTVLIAYDAKATTAKRLQKAAEWALAATRVVKVDPDFRLPGAEPVAI